MRLFIAEKPSLGRAIAAGLGGGRAGDGCIVCSKDLTVTWCFGHLLELCDPEDYNPDLRQWRRDTLPLTPQTWRLKPRQSSMKQLNVIGRLLQSADEVVNAGDPDREGQLLVDEVIEHFQYAGPVKRLWLASLDDLSVAKALAQMDANTRHAPLRDAARARSQADWLVGLNATRAMTIFGRESGMSGVLSQGRVQTPTLALVVTRDREIADFNPVDFFVLQGSMASSGHKAEAKHGAGLFGAQFVPAETQAGVDSEGRLVDAVVAKALVQDATGRAGVVREVTRDKKKKPVPLPHCLSSLQKAASARLGLTAQQVLDAAQALYEKKLTTYPRTDCRYLPEEQFTQAGRVLGGLRQVAGLEQALAGVDAALHGPVWDTKKITAHHAIIPTGVAPASLPRAEHGLYMMIATAYCLQFYPPMQYESQKIQVELDNGTLWEAKGRRVLAPGWTAATASVEDDDEQEKGSQEKEGKDKEKSVQDLPVVKKGQAITCMDAQLYAKKTTPPSRFSEGSLIEAMANVHRFVTDPAAKATLKENEGIGTEATRASIIETLKARGFLKAEKKALVSTALGQQIIDMTPATLKDPVTTAKWESRLTAMAQGKDSIETFMADQLAALPGLLEPILLAVPSVVEGNPVCPVCGRAMAQRQSAKGTFWGCTGYPLCRTTLPDDNGKPGKAAFTCSECGGPLRRIRTKRGDMCFACFAAERHRSQRPRFWNEQEGKPVQGAEPSKAATGSAPQAPAAGRPPRPRAKAVQAERAMPDVPDVPAWMLEEPPLEE